MATIWETTKTALTGLGVAMAANSYLVPSGQSLPAEFMVYQLISDPEVQSADDAETLRWQRMQVTYFNRVGLAGMPDIVTAMTAAGFRRIASRELPYSRETRHYGIAIDFGYLLEVG